MNYPKATLSNEQKEIFKELIDKGNRYMNNNIDSFVISGMLRLPDRHNGITEPEILCIFQRAYRQKVRCQVQRLA